MPTFHRVVAVAVLVALPALASAQWGVAPDGTKGRMHVVEKGDTLWDITETYLGTPWIWPSLWKENEIANPHRIEPGDVIWITERGMRKLTPEEAARVARLAEGEEPTGPGAAVISDAAPTRANSGASDANDPFASLDGGGADVERLIRFEFEDVRFEKLVLFTPRHQTRNRPRLL